MSELRCTVEQLTIEPHPNADRLELARVGDFRSIVMKDQFRTGSYGVYIPEGAIVPEWMLENMGLVGKLAGPQKNRVKAIKLRGVLSQGLIYPVDRLDSKDDFLFITGGPDLDNPPGGDMIEVRLGEDVSALLGITKYVPHIPASMSGDVFAPENSFLPKFDVEDIKRYPNVLEKGEPVMVTEKVHGTCVIFGAIPSHYERIPDAIDGRVLVASKGVCAKGLAFKGTDENIAKNLYIRTLQEAGMIARVKALADANGAPIVLLGEIFGKGVQDLHYGQEKPTFRLFDVYLPNGRSFASAVVTGKLADKYSIPMVPIIYYGAWKHDLVDELTSGNTWSEAHIREGIVIRPAVERQNPALGRVILKSVSADYLTRGGDVTEFQ